MTKPVAIVTGASRGVGRAIATALDGMGYRCALVARTQGDLLELQGELGGHHYVCPADLNCLDTLKDLVKRVVSQAGRLDVLVNNAQLTSLHTILESTQEEWDRTLHVNTLATMHLTREAAPHLVASGQGALINIVSGALSEECAGRAAYQASKRAVQAFSLAAFEELREYSVKVCAICLGLVPPPPDEDEERPPDTLIQAEDVARAVRFVLEFPSTGCPTKIYLRPQKRLQ